MIKNLFDKILYRLFKFIFAVEENQSRELGVINNILVVRQHNQLGDLLSGTPLFRALKEKYPEAHLTCIVSPQNADAIVKNKFIDDLFVFEKSRLIFINYLNSLINVLKREYDVVVVPVVVSISFTSNLLSRLAVSRSRIGPRSLDGKPNKSYFLFDRLVDLDWRTQPDLHVAEKNLSILQPFGISTNNFKIEISFDDADKKVAQDFITSNFGDNKNKIIGIHAGAGKPPNRWAKERFVTLIKKFKEEYSANIFLTASDADEKIISYIKCEIDFNLPAFINKSIPQLAALINCCELFITNDTGVMHVAGSTTCKQISLFGPTNPFNWAPIGKNKIFIRKSDLIDDISVDEVMDCAHYLLEQND